MGDDAPESAVFHGLAELSRLPRIDGFGSPLVGVLGEELKRAHQKAGRTFRRFTNAAGHGDMGAQQRTFHDKGPTPRFIPDADLTASSDRFESTGPPS